MQTPTPLDLPKDRSPCNHHSPRPCSGIGALSISLSAFSSLLHATRTPSFFPPIRVAFHCSYPASLTCDAILKFGQHLNFFSINVQKRYRAVIIVDSKRRAIDTIDCNELAISWSRFKGVYLVGSSYFLPSPSLCLRPQVPASKTTARYASIEPEPTTQTYLPR